MDQEFKPKNHSNIWTLLVVCAFVGVIFITATFIWQQIKMQKYIVALSKLLDQNASSQNIGYKILSDNKGSVVIKYPSRYKLKNSENTLEGSKKYLILSSDVNPVIQNLDFFTAESVQTFDDYCFHGIDTCSFRNITPNIFAGLKSAFNNRQSFQDYTFQNIGGQNYLISTKKAYGTIWARSYFSFVGETLVEITAVLDYPLDIDATDNLVALWRWE